MAKKRAVKALKKAVRRTRPAPARRAAGRSPKKQKAAKKRTKTLAKRRTKQAAPRASTKAATGSPSGRQPRRPRRAATTPLRPSAVTGMGTPVEGRFEELLTGVATIEIAEADGTTQAFVVVEMSNNGPHDIRAITVDQIHVVENVATTSARSEFDISAHFNPPVRIGWEIFAGMQFPRAGVFLERPGRPAQVLGQQAPLKKGVPWLDEKPVN